MQRRMKKIGRSMGVLAFLMLSAPQFSFSHEESGDKKEEYVAPLDAEKKGSAEQSDPLPIVRFGVHVGNNVRYGGDDRLGYGGGGLVLTNFSFGALPYLEFHAGQIARRGDDGEMNVYKMAGVDLMLVDSLGEPLSRQRGILNVSPYWQAGTGLSFFDKKTDRIGTLHQLHFFYRVGFETELWGVKLRVNAKVTHWSNGKQLLRNFGHDVIPGPNKGEDFWGIGIGLSF